MTDLVKKFQEKLASQQKYNMHLKFFEEDGRIDKITVPILTQFTGKVEIVPFRNTKCLLPSCIYDITELGQRYRQTMSNYITFICHTCLKLIDMNNFYLDKTLLDLIFEIWAKYNKKNQVICEEVTIYRDGRWDPVLPEYIKSLQSNMREAINQQKMPERQIDGYGEGNSSNQGRKQEVYRLLIKLSDFTEQEFDLLMDVFRQSEKGKQLQDIFLNRYDVAITINEFIQIQNDDSFSRLSMILFMRYLMDWQQRLHKEGENRYRIVYLMVKVINYDIFYKKAQYEIWSQNLGDLKLRMRVQDFQYYVDQIIIIIYHDQRWQLCYVDPALFQYQIIDFLSDGLRRVQFEDSKNIFQSIYEKQFEPLQLQIGRQESPEYAFLNSYSDCGIYVALFLYQFIIENRMPEGIPNIQIRSQDIERFQNQIAWLLLKFRDPDAMEMVSYYEETIIDEAIVDKMKQDQQEREEETNRQKQEHENQMKKLWEFEHGEKEQQAKKNNQSVVADGEQNNDILGQDDDGRKFIRQKSENIQEKDPQKEFQTLPQLNLPYVRSMGAMSVLKASKQSEERPQRQIKDDTAFIQMEKQQFLDMLTIFKKDIKRQAAEIQVMNENMRVKKQQEEARQQLELNFIQERENEQRRQFLLAQAQQNNNISIIDNNNNPSQPVIDPANVSGSKNQLQVPKSAGGTAEPIPQNNQSKIPTENNSLSNKRNSQIVVKEQSVQNYSQSAQSRINDNLLNYENVVGGIPGSVQNQPTSVKDYSSMRGGDAETIQMLNMLSAEELELLLYQYQKSQKESSNGYPYGGGGGYNRPDEGLDPYQMKQLADFQLLLDDYYGTNHQEQIRKQIKKEKEDEQKRLAKQKKKQKKQRVEEDEDDLNQ